MSAPETLRFTKDMASRIIAAVRADRNSQERIGDSPFKHLPSGLGWSGSARNWIMVLQDKDPTEYENYAVVCTGIADATSAAIAKAKIDGVAGASPISRSLPLLGLEFLGGTAHDATKVDLMRFGAVVMDWHATLQIDNPLIYPTTDAFAKGIGAKPFNTFEGC